MKISADFNPSTLISQTEKPAVKPEILQKQDVVPAVGATPEQKEQVLDDKSQKKMDIEA